ncbi:MAG: glycosyltransferase family 9 protein [Bacteroidales bacterium]|nr:glycosyltransferase family 9 protein [Bacteroidales bacterium]MBN2821238.1 glycosyltransferase family 9 protein [Bacteroidales bacterium]
MKKNRTKNINSEQKHLLVFRFSAMGDVVLTLPVVRGVLNSNPNIKITIVTRDFFAPFFRGIDRLDTFPAEFSGKHKGLMGLINLYRELKKLGSYDAIVDLHAVIRTEVLKFLFSFNKLRAYTLVKDRHIKEKYLHLKNEPKLKHSIERYRDVFKRLGIDTSIAELPSFILKKEVKDKAQTFLDEENTSGKTVIGIAPFAKHKLKMWPIKRIRNFIAELEKKENIHILLFGGGRHEKEQLKLLADRYKNCSMVDLELESELALMPKLDCMISMDSANMHIAALSGIPVFSVWGATHPGLGFEAWQQPKENTIQITKEELPCRPCTIYGKGICHRGDFACMERITPAMVINRLVQSGIIEREKAH